MDEPCSPEAIQGLDKPRNQRTDPCVPEPFKVSAEMLCWSWVGDQ